MSLTASVVGLVLWPKQGNTIDATNDETSR
jgi:hypothetical protein